jgi:Protein tyrosine and serine/threonine kinase
MACRYRDHVMMWCTQMYTTKTDVWSFGVMLVELCNCALPYSSLYMTPLQVAMAVADRHLTPAIEAPVPEALRRLAKMCLNEQPMLRPHFAQIVPQLRGVALALAKEARAAQQGASLLGRFQGMLNGAASAAAEMRDKAATRVRETRESAGGGIGTRRESRDGAPPPTPPSAHVVAPPPAAPHQERQLPRHPQPLPAAPAQRPAQGQGTAPIPGAQRPAPPQPPQSKPAAMFSGFLGRVRQHM